MNTMTVLTLVVLFVALASFVLLLTILRRLSHHQGETGSIKQDLRSLNVVMESLKLVIAEGFSGTRHDLTKQHRLLRGEVTDSVTKLGSTMQEQSRDASTNQRESLKAFSDRLHSFNQAVSEQLADMRRSFDERVNNLRDSMEKSGASLRDTVDKKLTEIRTDNATRLEEMRVTVDEKLQSTLDKRLGESFNLVNERLEAVHKGLGEMQQLANGVGDLKRVLTNVKTRGGWGEIQLGQLLQDMLAPNQYEEQVAVIEGSSARVEYAIKIPVEDGHTWLPVDAKFPKEDYERIVDAAEQADKDGIKKAAKQFEVTLKGCAKDIAEKYIKAPETTDYAVLYLPTEGLFAEVARRPDLIEFLQRQYRVVVAGPTTFSAVLTSIQLAFRTLAIQQRGDDVWKVLGATKSEFGKFGTIIDKVNKKLTEAGNHLEQVGVRTRAIERSLTSVESLDHGTLAPLPSPAGIALEEETSNG